MIRQKTWRSFREACKLLANSRWKHDFGRQKKGNIGWQSVGMRRDIRRNFSGLSQSRRWRIMNWRFLPMNSKAKHLKSSTRLLRSRAIKRNTSRLWALDAVGYSWADPFRGDRLKEVLAQVKINYGWYESAYKLIIIQFLPRILVPFLLDLPLTGKFCWAMGQGLADGFLQLRPKFYWSSNLW